MVLVLILMILALWYGLYHSTSTDDYDINAILSLTDSEVICNFKKRSHWLTDSPNNIGLRDASASKNVGHTKRHITLMQGFPITQNRSDILTQGEGGSKYHPWPVCHDTRGTHTSYSLSATLSRCGIFEMMHSWCLLLSHFIKHIYLRLHRNGPWAVQKKTCV